MSLILRYLNNFLISHAIILTFNALTSFVNFIVFKNRDV